MRSTATGGSVLQPRRPPTGDMSRVLRGRCSSPTSPKHGGEWQISRCVAGRGNFIKTVAFEIAKVLKENLCYLHHTSYHLPEEGIVKVIMYKITQK